MVYGPKSGDRKGPNSAQYYRSSVWREVGGSEGGQILRNGIAIVLQPRVEDAGGRGNERRIDLCTKPQK